MKNSVVIPDNIDPYTFGDGLKEYMQNPTNIKRKSNTEYMKKMKKISATARGTKVVVLGETYDIYYTLQLYLTF